MASLGMYKRLCWTPFTYPYLQSSSVKDSTLNFIFLWYTCLDEPWYPISPTSLSKVPKDANENRTTTKTGTEIAYSTMIWIPYLDELSELLNTNIAIQIKSISLHMFEDRILKLCRLTYNALVNTSNTGYHLILAAQDERRCLDRSLCRPS
jgi:hypothetical protein